VLDEAHFHMRGNIVKTEFLILGRIMPCATAEQLAFFHTLRGMSNYILPIPSVCSIDCSEESFNSKCTLIPTLVCHDY
jgi:hypothetical protein